MLISPGFYAHLEIDGEIFVGKLETSEGHLLD